MDPKELPVYRQRERIVEALARNQVIVVESPTGSGKTTQLPVILLEAGYSRGGMIGVTQPRRIAALSVTEFIARQLGTKIPGKVGYKMRFEDKTDQDTQIKIMTDGILLQEMKLDPSLSRYSVIMVDEAHERSLNIDFILGLLKRVTEYRPEFRIIVSSATINAEIFSQYFGECPVVKIETQVFPVTLVYDPPATEGDEDAMLAKVAQIVDRHVYERREGDVLVFLPGERAIKGCIERLELGESRRKLHVIPLYARLGKDEQERVFESAPPGKTKVVVATNIAETSVTIDGITSVIDSGLAKLNFYSPKTFTASLVEVPTSKASCNQRKGRAGRTRPGTCYRLYTRDDFENRPLFTMEEIYRTDLSEVVLRMAELGITEFERFQFVSQPQKSGILGAMESLKLLDALDSDRTLSKTGVMMCKFPLLPRHSRIIVEAIMNYPSVVEESIIAASFLSTQSPFVLPPGEELQARKAHHQFRDPMGDFVSYLRIFRAFEAASHKTKFCERSYLDERTMSEIRRVKEQLELIVHDIGAPIASGGAIDDYLCAVSRGLIQFVCARMDRGLFRSLTAEKIQIHPGSVMYRENPQFIVAGEIVRTTRMYAMSVSPLERGLLARVSPMLASLARGVQAERGRQERHPVSRSREDTGARDFTNRIKIADESFQIVKGGKDRKLVVMDWEQLRRIRERFNRETLRVYKGLKGVVRWKRFKMLEGEKLEVILRVAQLVDPERDEKTEWPRKREYAVPSDLADLVGSLDHVLQTTPWRTGSDDLGFVALFTDGQGSYWFRVSRGFHTAINESLASLEALVDVLSSGNEEGMPPPAGAEKVGALYRKLSSFFD